MAGGKQKEGSPQAQALEDKKNAYGRIHPILMREAQAYAAQQKAQQSATEAIDAPEVDIITGASPYVD